MVVADVNGDGKPDVVVANGADNTVSVLLNTMAPGANAPAFTSQKPFSTGSIPISVAVADVNGDGKPDLVVANARYNTVSVLLNTTAPGATIPTFAAQKTFPVGGDPTSVAVADINGDAKPDLIVANLENNTVSVLLNITAPGATVPTFANQKTFSTGATPVSVAVGDVNGDSKPDLIVTNRSDNTVSVLLNAPLTATGTIIESDAPPPTVSFAIPGETLGENTGSFSIPVNLSAATKDATTIPFIVRGTAVSGSDYTVDTNPLVIPAGQTTGAITGTIINDYALDRPQTLTFTLGTPTNATLGALTTNTMLIAETPPRGSITYKPGYASLTEPVPGSTVPYYFNIALDDISPVPVTVYYQTRDGSAKAGEDYRGVNSYRVTFPAFAHGATVNSPPSQDVAITVNGDASDGINPETFAVMLTSAYNATINSSSRSAIGTITQATPQAGTKVSIADFSAAGPSAGSTVFNVPITLDGPAAQPLTVYYGTAGGTATSRVDYVGQTKGHLTIGAGDTSADIPITILADAAGHTNVTFTITISYWVNNAIVSSAATVTITYPPAGSAAAIQADSLASWSNPTSAVSTEALDQVFAEMK